MRSIVTMTVGLLTGDAVSGPSLTDLVIRRRASGAEVMRISAGAPDEASRLLDLARRDLARLSVAQFIAEWQPAP